MQQQQQSFPGAACVLDLVHDRDSVLYTQFNRLAKGSGSLLTLHEILGIYCMKYLASYVHMQTDDFLFLFSSLLAVSETNHCVQMYILWVRFLLRLEADSFEPLKTYMA